MPWTDSWSPWITLKMKRFLTIFCLFICLAAGAQNAGLVKQLAGDGSLVCQFLVSGSAMAGSVKGLAWVQGDSYRIEADTYQITCNGKTRWIYDAKSDELVVENNNLSILDNPVERLADGSYSMTVKWEGGKSLTVKVFNLKQQKEKYPFEYFMMDPEKISGDTIVTDLR